MYEIYVPFIMTKEDCAILRAAADAARGRDLHSRLLSSKLGVLYCLHVDFAKICPTQRYCVMMISKATCKHTERMKPVYRAFWQFNDVYGAKLIPSVPNSRGAFSKL